MDAPQKPSAEALVDPAKLDELESSADVNLAAADHERKKNLADYSRKLEAMKDSADAEARKVKNEEPARPLPTRRFPASTPCGRMSPAAFSPF